MQTAGSGVNRGRLFIVLSLFHLDNLDIEYLITIKTELFENANWGTDETVVVVD